MKLNELKLSFNVILSDAMHSPDALRHEWRMIIKGSLLDLDSFAVVWDDCIGGLRRVFHSIVKHTSLSKQSGLLCHAVFSIHGWMGVHENAHSTCVMTTLDLRNISDINSLHTEENVTCTYPVQRQSANKILEGEDILI